jgi:hypothetical protein
MNRLFRLVAACVVCSVAACGGSDDKVTISLFQAAPDTIELGQSTKLVFVVDPPDAQVAIIGSGDYTGQTQAMVTPTVTTTYQLIATSGTATADASITVMVGAQNAFGIKLEPASAMPTAGQAVAIKLTAVLGNGKTAPGFRGTVHLSSTDARADLPADVTFTPGDAGVKQVMVTLKAAGLSTLTGTDTVNPGTQGAASVTVLPAAAASCAANQAPAATVAGSVVGVAVVVHDPFGNVATGYTGTVKLTASDARAILPQDVTYVPAADAGSHAFSAALLTTGSQILSAVDTGNSTIHCDAAILVTPAAPRFTLAAPTDANAGYAVNVGLVVKDLFDNAFPNYAGTVTFTSTDTGSGAVVPAPITFTGSEGGIASTSATFVTLGAQTLSASDGGSPAVTGSVVSAVHGLIYTAPTSGRVRLVANAAQSNAQVVQFDLIANERLEMSSFFTAAGQLGGPGSFTAGMNLPLDTTRAAEDATLFTAGNALIVGAGTATPIPPVAIGHLGTDHVLYTAVSRKRVAGTVFRQATEVQAGQVFYSVRLKLQATASVGPVFDGAQPSPLFRAAVRDQFGDDFVSQGDFGLGKLEVR